MEIKQFCKNLNFARDKQSKLKEELKDMEKSWEALKDKVIEIEAKVESLENCIEDLKEFEDRHKNNNLRHCMKIAQLRNCVTSVKRSNLTCRNARGQKSFAEKGT